MPHTILRGPLAGFLASCLVLTTAATLAAAEPPWLERDSWWPFDGGPVHSSLPAAELTGPRALRLPAGAFDPRAGEPALPAELRFTADEAARPGQPWIVQVAWPVAKDARRRLEEAGARVLGAVPNAAYLVRLPPGEAAAELPGVLWAGPLHPAWRLHPDIGRAPTLDPAVAAGRVLPLRALLFDDAGKAEAVAALEALGVRIDEASTWDPRSLPGRIYFLANPAQLLEAARLPGLRLIEEVALAGQLYSVESKPGLQSGAVFGGTPYHDAGILGVGQVVGIGDSGLDVDTILLSDTELDAGVVGPDHRKVLGYRAEGGGDMMTCSAETGYAHGTNVAQNALGNQSDFGLDGALDGLAPGAKVTFFDLSEARPFSCAFGTLSPPASLDGAYQTTLDAGGRLFNGSFGLGGGYNSHAADADDFLWQHREAMWVFAAGNGGGIGSPATAKNVVAVGGYYQDPYFDFFGSNGPAPDGRMAPTIMAPACDRPGGNPAPFDYETSVSITNDDADFAGPPSNTLNQGVCGTSFASPFTLGASALVRDYFEQGFHPGGAASGADAFEPSGALVKAVLMNSGEYLDCAGCGGRRMADTQGMGRLNLSLTLHVSGDTRTVPATRVVDRGLSDGLATGDTHVEGVTITDTSVPLRVTVVWVDAPQSALVNDLELEVAGPADTPDQQYLGNNFARDWSQSIADGGTRPDSINSFESVLIAPADLVPGDWTVTVSGVSVPEGDPAYADTQPFALVISGGFGSAPGTEIDCGNGVDDDGDGDLDCDDADCLGDPACPELDCANGLDDDGDGDVDCADADCAGEPACVESDCCNGLDDDGDGLTDFDDPDCAMAPPCSESDCGNGVDDDGDGDADCADSDCEIDLDGDGVLAAPCGPDCNDDDAGAFAEPLEVTGLLWSAADALRWDDQAPTAGGGTSYRVVRGRLAELPPGFGASESCLDDALALPEILDAELPPAGDGWWYLATAASSCLPDAAPWGADSLGSPRLPVACP